MGQGPGERRGADGSVVHHRPRRAGMAVGVLPETIGQPPDLGRVLVFRDVERAVGEQGIDGVEEVVRHAVAFPAEADERVGHLPAEELAGEHAFVPRVLVQREGVHVLFPRLLRDRVRVRAEREDVDQQRVVRESAHVEVQEPVRFVVVLGHVQRDPAERHQAGPPVGAFRRELVPLHAVVDFLRQRFNLGAFEILSGHEDARDQVRAVADRDAVDRLHAPGAAVHEMPEQTEVAVHAEVVRIVRVIPERVHRVKHARVAVVVRDPAALDSDADRREAESGGGDLAGAILGVVNGDAGLGIDLGPEVIHDPFLEVVEKRLVLGGQGVVERGAGGCRNPGGRLRRDAAAAEQARREREDEDGQRERTGRVRYGGHGDFLLQDE